MIKPSAIDDISFQQPTTITDVNGPQFIDKNDPTSIRVRTNLKLVDDNIISIFKLNKIPTDEERVTFFTQNEWIKKDIYNIGR